MTRQTSMQLTPATEAQVEFLKAHGHGPQFTDLVRIAIDRMAREEGYGKQEFRYGSKGYIYEIPK